jgi:hypothetical protein
VVVPSEPRITCGVIIQAVFRKMQSVFRPQPCDRENLNEIARVWWQKMNMVLELLNDTVGESPLRD